MNPTHKRLAEIKQRCEAATEGPWRPLNNFGKQILTPSELFGECGIVAKDSFAFIGQSYMANEKDLPQLEANLRLIAHSRTDIPCLLEALEVAMEALEKYKGVEIALGYEGVISPGTPYSEYVESKSTSDFGIHATKALAKIERIMDGGFSDA